MMKAIGSVILALSLVSTVHAAEDVVSAVHGTIKKVDSAAKIIVVKTGDGTEHSLHFLDKTAVHGVDASEEAVKDSWHGLRTGTEVVAHYTARGTEDTALEIDRVGEGGLKMTSATIKDIDRGGKKLIVKTSDGVESTFRKPCTTLPRMAGKISQRGLRKAPKLRSTTPRMPARKPPTFSRKVEGADGSIPKRLVAC